MRAAFDKVMAENGKAALQYGPTDGYGPLRQFIADSLSTADCKIVPEQIMMTSGSQQGLDLIAKVLVDEGAKILVETPSYLGALQAFSVYQPNFVSVEMDDNGVVPASVAEKAKAQNCSTLCLTSKIQPGRTLSIERRQELVKPAHAWAFL